MRYMALVCDYDGTLARDGVVPPSTVEALKRVTRSGRRLLLATGRQLDDLLRIFPEAKIFDRLIVENGAVIYRPSQQTHKVLASKPPAAFLETLMRRGVRPLDTGHSIVATWRPNETKVLRAIRESGLDLQVIFNKNAVMILPSSVNKASGLKIALHELGLSHHNVVGIGDAENDHVFLNLCECSVAVQNALPALKERADMVTQGDHGAGVEELIKLLLRDDLTSLEPRLTRRRVRLGRTPANGPFDLDPYDSRLLIAGPSGSGKSTTVAALIERLTESDYQVCLIDPEGDYDEFEPFVTLGGEDRIPAASEVLEILRNPETSISVNLLGVPTADRPSFFLGLLPRLQEMRSRTGRPHWIVIDEAHHLLPADLESARQSIPRELPSFALITVHADRISPAVLSGVNGIIAIGPNPGEVIQQFNAGSGMCLSPPAPDAAHCGSGRILGWMFTESAGPLAFTLEPAKVELRRHRRKYAAGELGKDKSFYFRGPAGKLNLRAQNMKVFVQLASGVDDDTWLFHLRQRDYSRWLRDFVKDAPLADEVAAVEQQALPPEESRAQVIAALERRYAAPS